MKRIYKVTVRLTQKEREALRRHVQSTGLSQEEYLRTLIDGSIPRAYPSDEFRAVFKELHAIGNNLNQIAMKAHAIGFIDAASYRENLEELRAQTLRIYAAVAEPERIVRDGNNENMACAGKAGQSGSVC